MDILNQIIEKLSKEELRFLKQHLGASASADRKDTALLDYIRHSGEKFDEHKIIRKLKYSTEDKNAYYRLKNRVLQDTSDSLVQLHTYKNELSELQHYLSLYTIYQAKALYKPCIFYLKKAERIAIKIENFELLDTVYASFIRLSSDYAEINPADYILLREENAKLVSQLRQLDDLLATATYQLRLTQNFGASDKKIMAQLKLIVKSISKQTTSQFSLHLQTRIYKALSQLLLQQHNYVALVKLVTENYTRFEEMKWFDKQNHDLKLQMITYAANALYKTSKYKESLAYSELLGSEILQFNKQYFDQYLFFYYNLKVLNYAVLDPTKALAALNEFQEKSHRKKNFYYDTFINLNRAGLLYDLGKYKESLKNLVKLYVSDSYVKADSAFKFKVEISELIITYQAADLETLIHRLGQVKKDYKKMILDKTYMRDIAILELLELLATTTQPKRNPLIKEKVKTLLKYKENALSEDSEIIKYRGWISKLIN